MMGLHVYITAQGLRAPGSCQKTGLAPPDKPPNSFVIRLKPGPDMDLALPLTRFAPFLGVKEYRPKLLKLLL